MVPRQYGAALGVVFDAVIAGPSEETSASVTATLAGQESFTLALGVGWGYEYAHPVRPWPSMHRLDRSDGYGARVYFCGLFIQFCLTR